MKNALQYYYNLAPITIHQINNDYRCKDDKNDYLFRRIDEDDIQIKMANELSKYLTSKNFNCHQIIPNIGDNIITTIDGIKYILLRVKVEDRVVNENDLYMFANQYINNSNYSVLDHSNWYDLWTNKIDYIEYQVSQMGKEYLLINKSINYYIGLAENAISLLSTINGNASIYKSLSHKRIKSNSKTREIYDPMQFVIDSRVRDLSEFYKEKFFTKEINFIDLKKIIYNYKLNLFEAILFFARMIFPSYYFDCYQSIIFGEIEETEIEKYLLKANDYQMFLKQIYYLLNQYYSIPEIEWIIKT